MSWIAGIVGASAGIAGKYGENYFKQFQQNRFNRKMVDKTAEVNYEYAQRYAENGPTWSVTGLRNAGLNPILATGGGFSSNFGSSVGGYGSSIPSDGDNEFSDILSQAESRERKKLVSKQVELQDVQRDNFVADTRLKRSEAEATTMKAQADVALINARIAKINQEVLNTDEGGGFRSVPISDLSRIVQRELYHAPTSSDDKSGYLYNGPSYDEQVISLSDGTMNGKVYMDADEVKKYGTKEAALKEFFRRVGESQKRYDDEKKRERLIRTFDIITNRKGRNITPW